MFLCIWVHGTFYGYSFLKLCPRSTAKWKCVKLCFWWRERKCQLHVCCRWLLNFKMLQGFLHVSGRVKSCLFTVKAKSRCYYKCCILLPSLDKWHWKRFHHFLLVVILRDFTVVLLYPGNPREKWNAGISPLAEGREVTIVYFPADLL